MNMKAGVLSLILAVGFAGMAHAGGFERDSQDFDILFLDGTQVRSGVTYVVPQRKLKHIRGSAAGAALGGRDLLTGRPFETSADESKAFAVPRASIKFDLTDDLACAGQYRTPWGAYSDVGTDTAIALSAIKQKISSTDIGLNCSYKWTLGPGDLRLLGGVSYQHLHGEQTQLLPPSARFGMPTSRVGALDVSDASYGWRAGLAYEIPSIAFRAQVIYQSEVNYDLHGTVDNLFAFPIDVGADATLPRSVELKVQTGIAPGWLAFGRVKWEDWSVENAVVFRTMQAYQPFLPTGYDVTRLNLYYRDGWTVTGGVGHQFDEKLSAATFVTWDRGVSTGLSSLTDTWLVGLSGAYKPRSNVEVRLTGTLGVLTSGTKDDTIVNGETNKTGTVADFGNDIVSSLSLAARVSF